MSTTIPDQDRQESVIAKIRKLFALAGNNPSEAEASAAMAKAQEMLASHNLSMAQIDQAQGESAKTTGDAPRTKEQVTRSAMFQFQRDLWQSLAEANFCVYWAVKISDSAGRYRTHHHYLIGREDNVEIVKVMGEYLEQTINRMCPYKVGRDVHLWKLGMVDRLRQRIRDEASSLDRETRTAQTGSSSTSTAVSLVDVRDRETHANHLFRYGKSSWCPCKRCRAIRTAEIDKRWAEEVARRPKQDAVATPTPVKEKTETEAQRRTRGEREARDSKRYWDRYYRQQEQEDAKRNSEAFRQGTTDAEKVKLNKQVK